MTQQIHSTPKNPLNTHNNNTKLRFLLNTDGFGASFILLNSLIKYLHILELSDTRTSDNCLHLCLWGFSFVWGFVLFGWFLVLFY